LLALLHFERLRYHYQVEPIVEDRRQFGSVVQEFGIAGTVVNQWLIEVRAPSKPLPKDTSHTLLEVSNSG
jgi:hypothetical protein